MTARFFAAIRDEGQWSFGKRMWSTAIGEGVDLSDQTALDGWIRQFNERPIAERDQILGRMPAIPSDIGAALLGALEPVVLPTDEELGALAAATVLVQRLTKLAAYVGSGTTVTRPRQPEAGRRQGVRRRLGTNDRVDERIGDHVYKTRSSRAARCRRPHLPHCAGGEVARRRRTPACPRGQRSLGPRRFTRPLVPARSWRLYTMSDRPDTTTATIATDSAGSPTTSTGICRCCSSISIGTGNPVSSMSSSPHLARARRDLRSRRRRARQARLPSPPRRRGGAAGVRSARRARDRDDHR